MKKNLSLMIATWFGIGLIPFAPGTFGALLALPLWYLLTLTYVEVQIAILVVGSLLLIPICSIAGDALKEPDSSRIVVDEVAGMLISLIAVPFSLYNGVLAFVVFRLLDIAKPGPIGWLDKNLDRGLGVMLDDILAGVVTCGIMHLVHAVWGAWL